MKSIRWLSVFQAVIILIYFLSMVVLSMLLYTGLVLQGQLLTAQNVFTTMVLYSNIKHSLCGHFGLQISYTLQGLAAMKRIQEFLTHQEKGKTSNYKELPEHFILRENSTELREPLLCDIESGTYSSNIFGKAYKAPDIVNNAPCVLVSLTHNSTDAEGETNCFLSLQDVSCYWTDTFSKPCLSNISLSLSNPSGELLAITGPVGSGKSSLLRTILGETKIANGKILQHGKVVYASQIPWIFTGTVRENILFGLPYNESRYKSTIEACQLTIDFSVFPSGDSTLIGERGIILSGGQRARVSLARAVYFNADIYLLDDPFSALDIEVGKRLFKQCVKGMLKSRLVILVTHQLSFLRHIDHIILLKDGRKIAEGSFDEIQNMGVDLPTSITPHIKSQPEIKNTSLKADDQKVNGRTSKGLERVEESRLTGRVALSTYCKYFRTGNSIFTLVVAFIVFIATQGTIFF